MKYFSDPVLWYAETERGKKKKKKACYYVLIPIYTHHCSLSITGRKWHVRAYLHDSPGTEICCKWSCLTAVRLNWYLTSYVGLPAVLHYEACFVGFRNAQQKEKITTGWSCWISVLRMLKDGKGRKRRGIQTQDFQVYKAFKALFYTCEMCLSPSL